MNSFFKRNFNELRFRAPLAVYNTTFSQQYVIASNNESLDNFFQHLPPYKFLERVKEKSYWMKGMRKLAFCFEFPSRVCVPRTSYRWISGQRVHHIYIFSLVFKGCSANFIIFKCGWSLIGLIWLFVGENHHLILNTAWVTSILVRISLDV